MIPRSARAHHAWVAVSYVLDPRSARVGTPWSLRERLASAGYAPRTCFPSRRHCRLVGASQRRCPRSAFAGADSVAGRDCRDTHGRQPPHARTGSIGRQQPPRSSCLAARIVEAPAEKSIASAAATLLSSRGYRPSQAVRLSVLGPLQIEFDGVPAAPRSSTAKRCATYCCCWSTSARSRAPGFSHCFGPTSTTMVLATTCE